MSSFNFGAININTNNYELASSAIKENIFKCPDCSNQVILKKGKIRTHHFAHSNENVRCNYYIRPNETQIHKESKQLLKYFIENDYQLKFKRTCENNCCIKKWKIQQKDKSSKIKLEHKFIYNNLNKIADVACLDNKEELWCCFEILVSHKTDEGSRPEPWFEIDGNELIKLNFINENKIIELNCYRQLECKHKYKTLLKKIPKLTKVNNFPNEQQKYCIECCKSKYNPIVLNNNYYAVCESCCKTLYLELHEEYLKEINNQKHKLLSDKLDKLNKIPIIYKFTREPFCGCYCCRKMLYSPVKHNNKYIALCKTCRDKNFNIDV